MPCVSVAERAIELTVQSDLADPCDGFPNAHWTSQSLGRGPALSSRPTFIFSGSTVSRGLCARPSSEESGALDGQLLSMADETTAI